MNDEANATAHSLNLSRTELYSVEAYVNGKILFSAFQVFSGVSCITEPHYWRAAAFRECQTCKIVHNWVIFRDIVHPVGDVSIGTSPSITRLGRYFSFMALDGLSTASLYRTSINGNTPMWSLRYKLVQFSM